MTQRLPTPGGDSGTWGDVLNGYLGVSLAADGTMNPGVVGATVVASGAATNGQVLTANGWGTASWASVSASGDNLGLTPTAVKTSAYTAVAGDFVPVDTTGGGVTVGLPVAPADKSVVAIKHVIQGSTNVVTFNCGGSDVFNKAGGSVTGTLTLASQGVLLQYKSSSAIWYVIADDLPLAQVDLRYAPIVLSAGTAGATVLASGAATANQVPLATGWGSATWGSLNGASLALTDVTTNNASASNHGFLPKLPNLATQTLLGDGTYNYAPYYSTNAQTNSYTAVLTDQGRIIEITAAAGVTFTVPTNASVAFPIGSVITVSQFGAGQITFAAASGATIVCASSHTKTNVQYSQVALRKQATDNWLMAGDTA